MACHMAVDIDCTGHTGNMGGHGFNVQSDGCGLSAKALRSDTKLVDFFKHLILKICIKRIRIVGIQRTHQCFLCKKGTFIKGSADTNADYHRRAGVGACGLYRFQDEVFDLPEGQRRV